MKKVAGGGLMRKSFQKECREGRGGREEFSCSLYQVGKGRKFGVERS